MAYASKDLSVLAYANGFTLWHYVTKDVAKAEQGDYDDVEADGYFNDAADMLRVGDIIVANLGNDSDPHAAMLTVRSNKAGHVSVSNMTN